MSKTREIWKVGGSVLTAFNAFEQVAARVREHLARRPDIDRLYVVVSAMKGRTDRAIRELEAELGARGRLSRAVNERGDPYGFDSARVASRLLQGEIESALTLREALARARVWQAGATDAQALLAELLPKPDPLPGA